MKTQAEVRQAFWASDTNLRVLRRPGGQNKQMTDVRVAFVDFVDSLARDGTITEALAQRVTL